MKKKLLATSLVFGLFYTNANAQSNSLNEVLTAGFPTSKIKTVNLSRLETQLQGTLQNKSKSFEVSIPGLNKTQKTFTIVENQVLSPELQAKYPNIKTYVGYSSDNSQDKIVLSYSPSKGVTALVLSPNNNYSIEKKNGNYEILTSKESSILGNFECGSEENLKTFLAAKTANSSNNNPLGVRKYKIGVVTDFDFNKSQVAEGEIPTKETSMLAIANVLNVVNFVYGIDLAIELELVDGTDELSILTKEDDKYYIFNFLGIEVTNLNDLTQKILDDKIGSANYDVGIVLTGKTDGGKAGLIGSVCNNSVKGSTYAGNVGHSAYKAAMIVAHELGHQFGANHVHARAEETGANVETGSGVTVMGYPGVTGTHDVVPDFVSQFNHHNLKQINDYLATTSCGVFTPNNNTPPVVTVEKSEYNIPKGTAFKLKGTVSDAESPNYIISNSWEQSDPLLGKYTGNWVDTSRNNTEGANFRVYQHQSSPIAYFPPILNVAEGQLYSTWNTVSDIARDMNFTLQARDLIDFGTSKLKGQIASEKVKVSVKEEGPFKITNIDLNQSIKAGTPFEVKWDVAGTDSGNINVKNVAIKLLNFEANVNTIEDAYTILASNVPNTGSAIVTIPEGTETSKANIIVEAVDNIFYAASPNVAVNRSIELVCKTYDVISSPLTIPDMTGQNAGILNLPALTIDNYNGNIENFSIHTDITHANQGELVFLMGKENVDKGYQFLNYANCSGKPNMTYEYNSYGGNTFENCGVAGAKITPIGTDLAKYYYEPANGTYYFRLADISPSNQGTVNKLSVEFCTIKSEKLSVSNIQANNEVKVYPNPSNGNFYIRLSADASKVNVNILNIIGQSVYSKDFTTNFSKEIKVEVGHLPKGVYIVKTDDGKQQQTNKIIIK